VRFGKQHRAARVLNATTSNERIVGPPAAGVVYRNGGADTNASTEIVRALA
jgi:hypothetical protein